jgi:protein-L-isoaspartate(D-aspartate) O-methyltransferase
MGLQIRDPMVRQREDAVRRMLQRGVLRTEALVEALLAVPPERYLSEAEVGAMLSEEPHRDARVPAWVGISHLALALEALEPGPGDRVADLLAQRGYVAAILARLVGASGKVLAVCPAGRRALRKLGGDLAEVATVRIVRGVATTVQGLEGPLDGVWLGAALPRLPRGVGDLLADPGGRLVAGLGPRFRAQDLVCVTRQGDGLTENVLARVRLPVAAGPGGWVK